MNNNNGQSYGYTLYETTIASGGALKSNNNVRDRALVRTDFQDFLYRAFELCQNIALNPCKSAIALCHK